MLTGSWIVVCKATNVAVLETFNPRVASAINRDKYDVLTAYDYLTQLNARLKAES